MMPLISRLRELRQAAGIEQQHIAATLGLAAKAGPSMVGAWEAGREIPRVGHFCGFAHTVGCRAVVRRGGETIGDLIDVWPTIQHLREAAGLSRMDVAECLYVHKSTVQAAERAAGPQTRLTTALRHLGALSCVVDLEPLGEVASC